MKLETKCNPKLTKERLCKLRHEKGWSQEEAAEAIGSKRTTWQQWELGTRVPNGPTLLAIAYTFNVNYNYICGLTDEITPPILNIPESRLQKGDRNLIESYLNLTFEEKRFIQDVIHFIQKHRPQK